MSTKPTAKPREKARKPRRMWRDNRPQYVAVSTPQKWHPTDQPTLELDLSPASRAAYVENAAKAILKASPYGQGIAWNDAAVWVQDLTRGYARAALASLHPALKDHR